MMHESLDHLIITQGALPCSAPWALLLWVNESGEQIAVLIPDGEDEGLQFPGQVVGLVQVILLGRTGQPHPDLAVLQEQDAGVVGVLHILGGLEQSELIVAGLGGIGAELGAVAALVAHLVHVEDLVAAVGHGDGHVCTVGAGIHAVFAHGGALKAAAALLAHAAAHVQDALLGLSVGLGDIGLLGNVIGVGLMTCARLSALPYLYRREHGT